MYKQISYIQKSTKCKLSSNEQLKIQTEAPMLLVYNSKYIN